MTALAALARGLPVPECVTVEPPAVRLEAAALLRRVAEVVEGAAPDACPRCGGELKPDTSFYLLRCSRCTRQWPPRVRPEVQP